MPSKIELVSGIATGILAVCTPLILNVSYRDFIAFILIAIVVAGASFLHVVHKKVAAFVILLLAGGIVSVIGIVGLAIVAVYTVSTWSVILIYLPGWTAFIAVVAAMVTQLRRRTPNP